MVEMGKNRHLLGSVLFGFYEYQGSVLFGFLSIFKWRVLVQFGSFKKEGSSSVRSVVFPSLFGTLLLI